MNPNDTKLEVVAKLFAERLAETIANQDPAREAEFQRSEALRDAAVKAALDLHLAKGRR